MRGFYLLNALLLKEAKSEDESSFFWDKDFVKSIGPALMESFKQSRKQQQEKALTQLLLSNSSIQGAK